MSVPERVLIVGYGYAGKRFRSALDYLQQTGLPVEVVGVCDIDDLRPPRDLAGDNDLGKALTELSPTVVCVTVSERSHGAVFTRLGQLSRALILSEKPFAASLQEGRQAASLIEHHGFSMNLVERFSPIVRECMSWMAAEGPFETVKIESFWGKHRIGDPRPTMGVVSEIIHPLDLIQHIFGIGSLKVIAASGLVSDFSPGAEGILDSVDLHAVANDVPVLLHSSFSWHDRIRRIAALIWSSTKGLFRLEMVFDTPHWDCDRLNIYFIAESGRWTQIHEMIVGYEQVPPEIRGVSKVTSFIANSVRSWRGEASADGLVDLGAALELQETLDAIERSTGSSTTPARYRRYPCR